jgi:hypothetical protein
MPDDLSNSSTIAIFSELRRIAEKTGQISAGKLKAVSSQGAVLEWTTHDIEDLGLLLDGLEVYLRDRFRKCSWSMKLAAELCKEEAGVPLSTLPYRMTIKMWSNSWKLKTGTTLEFQERSEHLVI